MGSNGVLLRQGRRSGQQGRAAHGDAAEDSDQNHQRPFGKEGRIRQRLRAAALADSGADHTFITRKAADWIGIGLDAIAKTELATPFGGFMVYRTLVRIAILYKGRRIDLGKVLASIPEKDIVQLGNWPFIVVGRSNVFNQYSVKFDDYRQILAPEKTAPGRDPPASAGTAQAVGVLAGGGRRSGGRAAPACQAWRLNLWLYTLGGRRWR